MFSEAGVGLVEETGFSTQLWIVLDWWVVSANEEEEVLMPEVQWRLIQIVGHGKCYTYHSLNRTCEIPSGILL